MKKLARDVLRDANPGEAALLKAGSLPPAFADGSRVRALWTNWQPLDAAVAGAIVDPPAPD